jgi:hypothetical protein
MRVHRFVTGMQVALLCAPLATCATIAAAHTSPAVAWLVFVDDLHLDFRTTGELRGVLKAISSELFRDGDLVGIHSSGPTRLTFDPTTDRRRFDQNIKSVIGNGMRQSDVLADSVDEVRHRAEVALDAAYRAIRALERIEGHRRVLLFVSNGYVNFDQVRVQRDRPELPHDALRSDVKIFTIDPRAFAESKSRDLKLDDAAWRAYIEETESSLRSIAEGTGGFAVLDADIPTGLRLIASALGR